ncbi:hypothetical protein MBLNU230_g3853t1 [Neophaeotheca triangularis]
MEELQARHKKEQKDLQGKITQKKKQANKKTRKGVNDECDRLEAELKERQAAELAELNGDATATTAEDPPEDALDGLNLNRDDDDNTLDQPNGPTNPSPQPSEPTNSTNPAQSQPTTKKPNRQKARLARRQAEQEDAAAQAAAEAKNLPDLKTQERERMLAYMKERGLVEKEIRADGHCLYSAFADQLEQRRIPLMKELEALGGGGNGEDGSGKEAYKVVRAKAAEYIEQHGEDFEPFLEEGLSEYVRKIRDTGEWGGQLELLALAKSFGVDINVLQDFGRIEKIEGVEDKSEEGREVWLGYYKHGFGLGEHYNSLRRAQPS